MGVSGQCHVPAALPPGYGHGTYCTGGWMDPRECLYVHGKKKVSCPARVQTPECPARSKSSYAEYVMPALTTHMLSALM